MSFSMFAAAVATIQAPVEMPPAIVTDIVPVELMVMTEVSTARAQAGDLVKLRVNRSVDRNGTVIVPVGTSAFGEVVSVSRSGIGMKRGGLTIRLTRLIIDGRDVVLGGTFDTSGRGGKADDFVKVVLVPFYAPFAPGNSAKFKAGDVITGNLNARDLVR